MRVITLGGYVRTVGPLYLCVNGPSMSAQSGATLSHNIRSIVSLMCKSKWCLFSGAELYTPFEFAEASSVVPPSRPPQEKTRGRMVYSGVGPYSTEAHPYTSSRQFLGYILLQPASSSSDSYTILFAYVLELYRHVYSCLFWVFLVLLLVLLRFCF